MTRRIEFEGQVHEFPDDFTDDEIAASLMNTPPVSAPATRRQPVPILREVTGALANVNRAIPFAQDVQGAIRGAGNVIQGRPFEEGYRAQLADNEAFSSDFMARRPLAANAAQGVGLAAQALPVARAAGAASAARGLPLFLEQTGRAATQGAASGFLQGFGAEAGGTLQERLQAGNEGAGAGAIVGGLAPAAVNATGALWSATRPMRSAAINLAERIPTPDPAASGAFGGNMMTGRRPPPRPPRRPPGPAPLPRAAAGTVDRLADRAGLTPDQVEQRLAAARERPAGQVLADIFDRPGRVTTRAIAQWPGRTGQRAEAIAAERAAEQPGRIIGALRRGLSVGETRTQAIGRLNGEYNRISANLYQPLWREPLPASNRAALEARLQPFQDDPVFADAVARANRVFARDRRVGLVNGAIDDNFARYAHYLKLGLDDASRLAANPAAGGGIGPTELRGIREMRAQVIAAIDDTIPGYREARNRWGGIINAEEALDEGAGFLSMLPEEVRARMAQMTEFEKLHARIGIVDEITRGMRGGRVVGQRNVANALDYRDTQDVIAAAFDSPQQAADFLDTLNTSNQLMRNSQAWGGGSQTYENAAHGADGALHALSDMAASAGTGNHGAAVARGVRGGINAVTMGAIERANNVRGEALLRRIDTPDSEEFGRQVVEELRRRAQQRAGRSAASNIVSSSAGAERGRRRD